MQDAEERFEDRVKLVDELVRNLGSSGGARLSSI